MEVLNKKEEGHLITINGTYSWPFVRHLTGSFSDILSNCDGKDYNCTNITEK